MYYSIHQMHGLLTSSVLTLRFRFALIKIQLYMKLNFFKFATSYFCSFSFDNQCLLGRLMRKELMFTYKLILPNLNCCTKSTKWKKVTLNKTRKCQFLKRWEFWPWMKEIIKPFLYQSLNHSILLCNKEEESWLFQKKATKQNWEQKSRLKYREIWRLQDGMQ